MNFSKAKTKFDNDYRKVSNLPKSLVPVDGKFIHDIPIRGKDGMPNEEYFKWQFIFSVIFSSFFPGDYIGWKSTFQKEIRTLPQSR